MEEYIRKSEVKAEIERLEKINQEYKKTWKWKFKWFYRRIIGRLEVLEGLKNFIDALEVKDINLDDKIYDYINAHYSEGCDGGMISDAHNDIGGVTYSDLTTLAEHFFKLGMQVRNKVQEGE